MTPEHFTQLIQKKGPQLRQLMMRTLPVKAGTIAQSFFKDNFRQSGFVDNSLLRWKRSKRQDNPKDKDRNYKTLLSRRNHLFNSIRKRTQPFTAIIFTDVIYAQVHNEGGTAGRRGHSFIMPKRQFIGESRSLNRLISSKIEQEVESLFK